jgi:hypothetical protein
VLPQALRCVCDRCLGARVLRLEREDSCDMDGFERCTHEETAEETVTRRCVLRRDHAKFGHDDHVMD